VPTAVKSAPKTRRQRAEATRGRIVRAAAELFRTAGYAATTMTAIAERADVAVQTVYFTFHTKTALLAAVADEAITGGTAETPERAAWVQRVFAAPNGRRRIALTVEGSAEVIPRMLPVADAWRAAMSADPGAGEQYRARLLARRGFLRRVVERLREDGELRRGLEPERAADVFFALTAPESFDAFVRLLGWTERDWITWTTKALERELLA
jgi:AcrR family transcriptional regulator